MHREAPSARLNRDYEILPICQRRSWGEVAKKESTAGVSCNLESRISVEGSLHGERLAFEVEPVQKRNCPLDLVVRSEIGKRVVTALVPVDGDLVERSATLVEQKLSESALGRPISHVADVESVAASRARTLFRRSFPLRLGRRRGGAWRRERAARTFRRVRGRR
jgi:hypothetical protein